jgi:hypothetical protein
MLDTMGGQLESLIDYVELAAARRRFGPPFVGVALAVGVIAGGLGLFVAVFAVLVGFFG